MTLSDLERLAREATPGKRSRTTSGDRHWLREVRGPKGDGIAWCGHFPESQALADAAFIAACDPDTVLALLRVVRAAVDVTATARGPVRRGDTWVTPHKAQAELIDALAALNLKDET